jgi:MSHA pilin protein MshC
MYVNCSDSLTGQRGFTLLELITIMIILGIVSVVAIPRMTGSDDFVAEEFRTQVLSTLRFAHKAATTHRRLVCVSFTQTSVSLRIARQAGASNCDADMSIPALGQATLSSRQPNVAFFATVPDAFLIQSDGSSADRVIRVAGRPDITVSGQTGYVR